MKCHKWTSFERFIILRGFAAFSFYIEQEMNWATGLSVLFSGSLPLIRLNNGRAQLHAFEEYESIGEKSRWPDFTYADTCLKQCEDFRRQHRTFYLGQWSSQARFKIQLFELCSCLTGQFTVQVRQSENVKANYKNKKNICVQ